MAKQQTLAQLNRSRERVFRPIAIEIGWMVYQWNRLHEALAELFADVVSHGRPADGRQHDVPLAIWHCTPSDRTQRDMLSAALAASFARETPKPRIYNDIKWILGEMQSLAGRRNNAVHAPLIFVNDMDRKTLDIMPNYFFGNPRATELKDKNLLREFWWYKDHLARLAQFAERLHYAFTYAPDFAWPDRPELPSVGHYQSPKPKRLKSSAK